MSLAVIIFEVTGGLETIVPIMIAVVFSKWFGDAFGKAGLYGRLIELNGLPHIDTHVELDLINPAAEMMVRDPLCLLTYGQSLQSLQHILHSNGHHGFPIIDNVKDRLVTGFIARADLELEMGQTNRGKTAATSTRTHARTHARTHTLSRTCMQGRRCSLCASVAALFARDCV